MFWVDNRVFGPNPGPISEQRGKLKVTLTKTYHIHTAAVFIHMCRGISKKLLARGFEKMGSVTHT